MITKVGAKYNAEKGRVIMAKGPSFNFGANRKPRKSAKEQGQEVQQKQVWQQKQRLAVVHQRQQCPHTAVAGEPCASHPD